MIVTRDTRSQPADLSTIPALIPNLVSGADAPAADGRTFGKIDPAKMNPNGSSLATGHPFAATGARIVATVAKELKQRGGGRALVSICTAGGMGVVAIIER